MFLELNGEKKKKKKKHTSSISLKNLRLAKTKRCLNLPKRKTSRIQKVKNPQSSHLLDNNAVI